MQKTESSIFEQNSKRSGVSKSPTLGADWLLHLADNTLILAQRNAEWCGHGPILEQDIAITNISLDLLGQSRNFYQYAAQVLNDARSLEGIVDEATEDSLAYLRTEREFKNCLLVEQPNGDWGQTILRQFFFSAYQYLLYQQLQNNPDAQVAAIAAKALKEVAYHLRWSGEWVVRLGDGTDESRSRMLKAIDELWRYTGELFVPASYELEAGVDVSVLKQDWLHKVTQVFEEATLPLPILEGTGAVFMQTGGKTGIHTEHLGYILTDLQYMQRTYPNASW